MACERCMTEPYFEKLCTPCFLEQVARKVRKDIRTHGLIKRGDTLIIADPLCEQVVRDIVQGMPITLADRETQGKRVLPWTMDDELHYFLSRFFAGEAYPHLGHGEDIKLFLSIREKELMAFARAKGLPYAPKPRDRIRDLIDRLEARHPETKFSLAKSVEEIREIIGEHPGTQTI